MNYLKPHANIKYCHQLAKSDMEMLKKFWLVYEQQGDRIA
jgi:hypothetical protein